MRALAATRMVRALARLRVGRPADAAEDAREALDLAQRGGVDVDPRFAGAYLAEALADLGDLDGAEATLESVGGFDVTDPGPAYYARRGSRPGPARAGPTGRGARRGACRRAARGRRTASPTRRSGRGGARRRCALHALGEVDEALRLAEEEVAAGPALGRPDAGTALLTAGARSGERPDRAARGVGRGPGGQRSRVSSSRAPYAAWGAALRRDNQRTRARAVLDEALDLAQLLWGHRAGHRDRHRAADRRLPTASRAP